MKLAISNIAWNVEQDEQVRDLLYKKGIRGIEVAPTKIWQFPDRVSYEEAIIYKKFWDSKEIQIVGAQSLLYNKGELAIFDPNKEKETIEYLEKMIRLVSWLGGRVLVFGSPKNRRISGYDIRTVYHRSQSIFKELAEFSYELGCVFCIEPNPPEYGCDFVTNMSQALELVSRIDHPGFRLHLDTSSIFINEEIIEDVMEIYLPFLEHVHISEPFLEKVGDKSDLSKHNAIYRSLRKINYIGWVSIEMKFQSYHTLYIDIINAIDFVKRVYLNPTFRTLR